MELQLHQGVVAICSHLQCSWLVTTWNTNTTTSFITMLMIQITCNNFCNLCRNFCNDFKGVLSYKINVIFSFVTSNTIYQKLCGCAMGVTDLYKQKVKTLAMLVQKHKDLNIRIRRQLYKKGLIRCYSNKIMLSIHFQLLTYFDFSSRIEGLSCICL